MRDAAVHTRVRVREGRPARGRLAVVLRAVRRGDGAPRARRARPLARRRPEPRIRGPCHARPAPGRRVDAGRRPAAGRSPAGRPRGRGLGGLVRRRRARRLLGPAGRQRVRVRPRRGRAALARRPRVPVGDRRGPHAGPARAAGGGPPVRPARPRRADPRAVGGQPLPQGRLAVRRRVERVGAGRRNDRRRVRRRGRRAAGAVRVGRAGAPRPRARACAPRCPRGALRRSAGADSRAARARRRRAAPHTRRRRPRVGQRRRDVL